MNIRDPRLRSALAAEYALGTLHGPARRRFEALMVFDPALRREVDRWQGKLYTVVDALPERQPPPRIWQALERATAPPPAAEPRRPRLGLWDSLVFWRSVTAMVCLVVLSVVIHQWQAPVAPLPSVAEYVAVISGQDQTPAWLVQLDRDAKRVRVLALNDQQLAADRSFELWLLPGEGRAPKSMGLLPPSGGASLDLPAELEPLLAGATGLAVSLEPQGGSPTGLPTGPVLYQGGLVTAPGVGT